jgi:hypothetical protein
MQPTLYQGDVRITTSTEPSTYGTGSLQVDDDLLILGTFSEHRVTNLFTQDNIVGFNQPPPGPDRDIGWLGSRDLSNIITDTPTETGLAQAGSANTITLAVTSNVIPNYYQKWAILITGGPGVGESKYITTYSGPTFIATVDSNWTVQPTNASTYSLFSSNNVGMVWCEVSKEMQVVSTPFNSFDIVVTPTNLANLHVHQIITDVPIANVRNTIPVVTNKVMINTIAPKAVGYFDWDAAEYTGIISAKLFYNLTVPGSKTAVIEVYNETTSTILSTATHAVSGFYKLAFANPVANAELSLRVNKNSAGGKNPILNSAAIILDPAT